MKATRSSFGQLDARGVGLTTLVSDFLALRMLDYGATVLLLLEPDRDARVEDVVLVSTAALGLRWN